MQEVKFYGGPHDGETRIINTIENHYDFPLNWGRMCGWPIQYLPGRGPVCQWRASAKELKPTLKSYVSRYLLGWRHMKLIGFFSCFVEITYEAHEHEFDESSLPEPTQEMRVPLKKFIRAFGIPEFANCKKEKTDDQKT